LKFYKIKILYRTNVLYIRNWHCSYNRLFEEIETRLKGNERPAASYSLFH